FHTRDAATPIITYSAVQTGANTQLGGLNHGFCNAAYQVGMDGSVKKLAVPPTSSDRKMKNSSGRLAGVSSRAKNIFPPLQPCSHTSGCYGFAGADHAPSQPPPCPH